MSDIVLQNFAFSSAFYGSPRRDNGNFAENKEELAIIDKEFAFRKGFLGKADSTCDAPLLTRDSICIRVVSIEKNNHNKKKEYHAIVN